MGIRFRCHHCEHEMHVKDFQGGKRGKCPQCSGKFRIPTSDSDHSLALDDPTASVETTVLEGEQAGSNAEAAATQTASSSPKPAALKNGTMQKSAAVPMTSKAALPAATPPPPSSPPPLPSSPQASAAFRDHPAAQWHVRPPSGGQYGPAAVDAFFQWITENRVTGDSLVWREGMAEWSLAASVFPEFFQGSSVSSSSGGAKDGRRFNAPTSPKSKSRQLQKKRAEKRYTLMVASLAVVAVLLVIALIVVLVLFPSGTSQPT